MMKKIKTDSLFCEFELESVWVNQKESDESSKKIK